jgi:hypothetical protein
MLAEQGILLIKMIVKKHVNAGRLVLAVCDNSLINKRFENSGIVLDLTSKFYRGRKMTKSEFVTLVKKAYIINAVGVGVVGFLINLGVCDSGEVKTLTKIPYIQIIFG